MKFINSVLKFFLWSVAASVFLRIIYGLYFGYTAISLVLSAILGITGSLLLSTTSTAKFAVTTFLHIVFVAVLSYFYDFSGFLRALPYDSAAYFSASSGYDGIISLIWPILTVTPIYFIVLIILSALILASRHRRSDMEAEEEGDEESEL